MERAGSIGGEQKEKKYIKKKKKFLESKACQPAGEKKNERSGMRKRIEKSCSMR